VDEKLPALDYAKPKEKLPTELDDFVTGLFVGRLRSKWFYRQLAYSLVLAVFFWLIAFQFGANYFFFGKMSDPTPADFVAEVEQYCVPVVRAMKEYQRDHGRLPNDMNELIPDYLPDQSHNAVQLFGAQAGRFERYADLHHRISYDFTPGDEHWEVSGPYVNGRIPLPAVKVTPATRPTTQTN
jgi:hypothetical protein